MVAAGDRDDADADRGARATCESLSVTVWTVVAPAAVGVPEIVPVAGSRARPAGSGGSTLNVAVPVRRTRDGENGVMGMPKVAVIEPG